MASGDLETAESCLKALPEAVREGAEREDGSPRACRSPAKVGSGESLAALQSAHEANPADSGARYRLAVATALAGDVQIGMDHLLHLVRTDPEHDGGAPREKLLALFDLLGDDPLAGKYRRKLFALLH